MNSEEFMMRKIDRLVDNFPNIQVRYEFDGSHIVEVLPTEMILDETEEFEEAMNGIFLEFDAQFQEDLMFVTEGDYVGVKNVTYQKSGSQFVESTRSVTYS